MVKKNILPFLKVKPLICDFLKKKKKITSPLGKKLKKEEKLAWSKYFHDICWP